MIARRRGERRTSGQEGGPCLLGEEIYEPKRRTGTGVYFII